VRRLAWRRSLSCLALKFHPAFPAGLVQVERGHSEPTGRRGEALLGANFTAALTIYLFGPAAYAAASVSGRPSSDRAPRTRPEAKLRPTGASGLTGKDEKSTEFSVIVYTVGKHKTFQCCDAMPQKSHTGPIDLAQFEVPEGSLDDRGRSQHCSVI